MNKLSLFTFLFAGCAIREKANPSPSKDFNKLDKNEDSFLSLQEFGQNGMDIYNYADPIFWTSIIIGSVVLISLLSSSFFKK